MRGLAMGLAPRLAPLAPVLMMAPPPAEPPPTISTGLLAVDGAVCVLYSLSASISQLFTSGEYLTQSLYVTAQDMVDLAVAFDSALALALGWCLASVVTGVCSQDWLALSADEHAGSVLGVKGILSNWLLGFPLGEVIKALALYSVFAGGWASTPGVSPAEIASSVALDGAGTLVVITLWRRWLVTWSGYGGY